jgi:deoxyribodipyrimidine photo-lyase
MMVVPAVRVTCCNRAPVRSGGSYVLYWMIAARRTRHNFGLQHAVAEAGRLGKGLVVFEPLRVGYRWASHRHHRFVIEGMIDNAARCAAAGVRYLGYVEPWEGAGQGLLEALAERAALVVTDEFPTFFLPRMVEAAAERLTVRLDRVDSNGLLPLRAAERAFTTAASFRRHLQKTLPVQLLEVPVADPLAGCRGLPAPGLPAVLSASRTDGPWAFLRFTGAGARPAFSAAALASGLPIDQSIGAAWAPGGADAGEAAAAAFVDGRLDRYGEERNEPDADAASGLSPYLHFGHVSVHDVVARVIAREDWNPGALAPRPTGSREGWWGMSAPAESFLDELVTWRELGYNVAHHRPDDHDRYESLPGWAQTTLAAHAGDPRPHRYDRASLADAATHDPLWNAAQRQLLLEGRIHNYLRMLWGKKILEWSSSPRAALAALIELNNRYAIDGRDPNSYSGIFWTLGRFDRPWGPERPIFGTVRYMSSENAARKLKLKGYLARYGAPKQRALL